MRRISAEDLVAIGRDLFKYGWVYNLHSGIWTHKSTGRTCKSTIQAHATMTEDILRADAEKWV